MNVIWFCARNSIFKLFFSLYQIKMCFCLMEKYLLCVSHSVGNRVECVMNEKCLFQVAHLSILKCLKELN